MSNRSNCCKAKLYVIGAHLKIDVDNIDDYDINPGQTYYYECEKCKKPCDLETVDE